MVSEAVRRRNPQLTEAELKTLSSGKLEEIAEERADETPPEAVATAPQSRQEAPRGPRRSPPGPKAIVGSIAPSKARKIVLASMVGTGAIILTARAVQGKYGSAVHVPDKTENARVILGLVVVYVILGFASDFAPQFAGPLALLVFATVLFKDGPVVFDAISKREAKNPPAKTGAKGRVSKGSLHDQGKGMKKK